MWRECQPGCSEVTSVLPCLLLLFSLCSLRRFFSSLLTCPRLHFLILHFFLWMVSEQGSPPNWGSSFTMRVLIVWPFPQDLLHSDHSVHSDMSQSMAEETELVYKTKTSARFSESSSAPENNILLIRNVTSINALWEGVFAGGLAHELSHQQALLFFVNMKERINKIYILAYFTYSLHVYK